MAVSKDGFIYVASKKAGEEEMVNVRHTATRNPDRQISRFFQIRTNAKKTGPVDWRAPDDKKSAKDCSLAYV